MHFVLALAPALAFILIQHLAGSRDALFVATAVAVVLILGSVILEGRRPRMMNIGSTLLFGGLSLYVLLSGRSLNLGEIKLLVDAGLLALVVVSIAAGRPFTLDYAPRNGAPDPEVLRTHRTVSAAWGGVFLMRGLLDLAWVLHAGIKPAVVLGISALLGLAALLFSRHAVGRLHRKHAHRVAQRT